jgi:DNA invertase Pin-like site-specific DNA recombinase
MKAHVYLRVSTDEQDVDNQNHGITAYLEQTGLERGITCRDTASGRMAWQERAIAKMLEIANAGDAIVVSEISRLGRSTLQVLEIAKACADRGLTLHAVKSNLILDGSAQSKILATVLGLAAEIERDFIAARTAEALQKRKAAGLPMGRPVGEQEMLSLDKLASAIENYEEKGISRRGIARLVNCSPGKLYLWIKRRHPEWLQSKLEKEI